MNEALRPIELGDARAIRAIALENNHDLYDKDISKKNGFITYVGTNEEYEDQIKNSHNASQIYENDLGNTLGFIMIVPIKKIKNTKGFDQNNAIFKALIQTSDEEALYISQIAVKVGRNRKGIATKLLTKAITKANGRDLMLHAVHEPVKNVASISLFKSLGFEEIYQAAIDTKTIGGYRLKTKVCET